MSGGGARTPWISLRARERACTRREGAQWTADTIAGTTTPQEGVHEAAAIPTRLLYRDSPNDAPLGPAWRTVGDVLRDSPSVRRIRETPEYVEDAANVLGWARQLADHEIDRATFRQHITGPMIFRSCACWGYDSEEYALLCEALRWKEGGQWVRVAAVRGVR